MAIYIDVVAKGYHFFGPPGILPLYCI